MVKFEHTKNTKETRKMNTLKLLIADSNKEYAAELKKEFDSVDEAEAGERIRSWIEQ